MLLDALAKFGLRADVERYVTSLGMVKVVTHTSGIDGLSGGKVID